MLVREGKRNEVLSREKGLASSLKRERSFLYLSEKGRKLERFTLDPRGTVSSYSLLINSGRKVKLSSQELVAYREEGWKFDD